MRTFVLAYDRKGEEIDNEILLEEVIKFLVKEGAGAITHSLASTLTILCDNKYTFRHWSVAFADFGLENKAFFSFSEVYQCSRRHIIASESEAIDHDAFAKRVKAIMDARSFMPVPRL